MGTEGSGTVSAEYHLVVRSISLMSGLLIKADSGKVIDYLNIGLICLKFNLFSSNGYKVPVSGTMTPLRQY